MGRKEVLSAFFLFHSVDEVINATVVTKPAFLQKKSKIMSS